MWRLLLALALAGVGFAAGWQVQGWRHGAADTKAAIHTVQVTRQQGAISMAVAAKDAAVQTEIRWRTKTLIEKVPTYVTAETDRRFPLSTGLVRLHDAAALGEDVALVTDPAGKPDDQASAVEASDLARTVSENYGECRADAARLIALQDWYTAQEKAFSAH